MTSQRAKDFLAEQLEEFKNQKQQFESRIVELEEQQKGQIKQWKRDKNAAELIELRSELAEVEKKIETVPAINGDYELLAVAAANLLKNAKEAIRGKGGIHIETGEADGFVFLSVTDSGTGMDVEELEEVVSEEEVEEQEEEETDNKAEEEQPAEDVDVELEKVSEEGDPLFGTEENEAEEDLTKVDEESSEEETSDNEAKSQWSDTNPFIET